MRTHFTLLTVTLLAGCQSPSTDALDPDRILHMAGEEAGQIGAPRERLTRQLNIANRETNTGHPDNARKTLVLARQTLEKAGKNDFKEHERLAGWVSLCELSRNAGDKVFAGEALDQALAALRALTPEPARCEYVMGIEHEVRALRGDAAAADLLRTAGDWAMDLSPQKTRRVAYLEFVEESFRCNDYDGGRKTLRHDSDAAWRSDALTAMSDRVRYAVAQNQIPFAQRGFMDPTSVVRAAPKSKAYSDSGQEMFPTTSPAAQFDQKLDFQSTYFRP